MRVLITGGAGFIGAHLGAALQERGDELIVVDNFSDYYDPRLKHGRVAALLRPKTPIVSLDIAEADRTARTIADLTPDAVVHLAALPGVRPSREHPAFFARSNVLGAVNVFEACRRAGVRRVVFASSSSVYGHGAPVPSSEEEVGGDGPASGYGVAKRAGELYARLYHALDGLRITSLRYFTVYGPWGRPDMALWKFTRRILRGDPLPLHARSAEGREVRRDFTEIRDVVRGTLAALDRNHPWAVVNIGRADPVPLTRFVRLLEEATGRQARIEERTLPPEEAVETGAELSRARSLLGYEPTIPLTEGLPRFVRWYREDFLRLFPGELSPSPYWD